MITTTTAVQPTGIELEIEQLAELIAERSGITYAKCITRYAPRAYALMAASKKGTIQFTYTTQSGDHRAATGRVDSLQITDKVWTYHDLEKKGTRSFYPEYLNEHFRVLPYEPFQ